MINVLYDYRAWELQRYGGVSRYFYEIIKHNVCSNNIAATVFAGLYQNNHGIKSIHNGNLLTFGKKVSYPPKTYFIFSLINEAFFWAFSNFKSKYDVYHPTYYYSHRPKLRAAQVVTVFDMIHELSIAGQSPRRFKFFKDKTREDKARTIRDSDTVIAISNSTKRDLINILGIEEKKIKVIYLANSLNHEVKDKPIINQPYILYVGARGGYKNFKILLKAYSINKRISGNFKLVTFAGEAFNREEMDEIQNLGVTGKIEHIEGDDITLSNLYKYASVFVFTSLYEGFGLPLLEAMHYGCPVIASNRASIPEVVMDAGILFNPTDEEELLSTLEEVLFDNELRQKLISSGYRIESRFNWDITAKQTLEVYKELVGQ